MPKATSAASAASFLSTKADKAPKSRKPSAKSAHSANMDAAQRELDARSQQGEDMSQATICEQTYAIVKPQPPATPNLAAQLAAAAPQIAAKQAEKPAKRSAPDLKLVIAKTFKPRTNQLVSKKADGKGNFAQQNNWDALVAAIQAHGGAISYADAVAAVEAAGKDKGYEATCNARGFVQGRVRNGHVKAA